MYTYRQCKEVYRDRMTALKALARLDAKISGQAQHSEILLALEIVFTLLIQYLNTGSRSAVGNMSDCRSRGREFDPGPIPYFRGD